MNSKLPNWPTHRPNIVFCNKMTSEVFVDFHLQYFEAQLDSKYMGFPINSILHATTNPTFLVHTLSKKGGEIKNRGKTAVVYIAERFVLQETFPRIKIRGL